MALRNIALVGNAEKYKIGARSTFKRKNQLIAAFVIGVALTSLFMITAKPAPVWTYLGTEPTDYILVGDGYFILPGQDALSGKYYKVDVSSSTSGLDASYYEVSPAGFPIGFTFVDKGYGLNAFNVMWFFVDVLFWMIFAFIVIYKFGFFERTAQQPKEQLPKKKFKSL
jgi:hypothetical protein